MMDENDFAPRILTQMELKKLRNDMLEASFWMRNELRRRRITGKRDGEAGKRLEASYDVLSVNLDCREEP